MRIMNDYKLSLVVTLLTISCFAFTLDANTEHPEGGPKLTLVNKTRFKLSFPSPLTVEYRLSDLLTRLNPLESGGSRTIPDLSPPPDCDDGKNNAFACSYTEDFASLNFGEENTTFDVIVSNVSNVEPLIVRIKGQDFSECFFPYNDHEQYSEIMEIRYNVEWNGDGWKITFFEQVSEWGSGKGLSPEVRDYLKWKLEAVEKEL